MQTRVPLRVLLVPCLFSSGRFSDGWLNINFKCTAGCFRVVPAADFTSCSFPSQVSITRRGAVSTPPAPWRGCDTEIPAAPFPLPTWSSDSFGGEGAAWGLSGCYAAVGGTGGPGVPLVLDIWGVSGSVAHVSVVHQGNRCLLVRLLDTWWPEPGRAALGLLWALECPRSAPSLQLCAVPWSVRNCAQSFF